MLCGSLIISHDSTQVCVQTKCSHRLALLTMICVEHIYGDVQCMFWSQHCKMARRSQNTTPAHDLGCSWVSPKHIHCWYLSSSILSPGKSAHSTILSLMTSFLPSILYPRKTVSTSNRLVSSASRESSISILSLMKKAM